MVERMLANMWVALVAMRTQSRAMRGNPSGVILGIVQPVVFLVIAAGTRQPSPQRSTEVVVGVGLTALWGSTIWSAGGILRGDMFEGTLARSLIGVRSATVVFLGKCLGATIRTSALISLSTVAAALAMGLPLRFDKPLPVLLGLAFVLLSATALGMVLSCLFLVTRHGAAWSAALMYPVFIISGMIIPLELVPGGLREISLGISLRWAADFLSTSLNGTPSWSAFAVLSGLTCLYFVLALTAFGRQLDRARREGTFDHA